MSTYTIHVSGISDATTEQHLTDFFTFCGKISKVEYNQEKHTATIHFEKPSAAKTALMLNGGTLDGAHLTITSDHVAEGKEEGAHHGEHIDQSDKPRAGIAAEYLAKGYTLSDQILQRAIELDKQHGISNRFLSYIQSLDTKVGERALGPEKTISGKVQETLVNATQQAKAIDEQRGITKTASDYYARALSSPFGQKVKAFYTSTSKQVLDIHEEARRINEAHKSTGTSTSSEPTPTSAGVGSAAPPLSSEVHSVATSDATTTGGAPKTTEAPTVV
ncbi:hypothetical protein L226DRAFT_509852 [Lentinus tigrinus ALCF2SS1-7]|uniref:RRM domain-containing protein n=1 Tax=Lentinus tigrinus ALCF2SS1-6 TaxID=1328759 RepID=A0A5C2RYQ2_9APHY|nr:hypothetical protein L227DRAFT_532236 [Lentinus tigrinus ALCF2SS1-6]RPD74015.1 hypothetical protein L226DRAFT_509852 [Lentinus tigrinus ALCF2SS1-7]